MENERSSDGPLFCLCCFAGSSVECMRLTNQANRVKRKRDQCDEEEGNNSESA